MKLSGSAYLIYDRVCPRLLISFNEAQCKMLIQSTYITTFLERALKTRMPQHKCLPHLVCINPTPLLFKKKCKIQKMISKFEKSFTLVQSLFR